MTSKALTDRQKQVDHLIGYIQTHAERTAKILTVRAEKLGVPESVPDLWKAQLSQAWWLREGYEALRRKEAAYLRRKHEAPELRKRRAELTRELYDQLVAVRGFLERVYGKPAATRLTGLEGRTPRDPWELARAGSTLVDRLRTQGGEVPEPRFPGVDFEPEVTAAGLEVLARELAEVLRSLREWDREMDPVAAGPQRSPDGPGRSGDRHERDDGRVLHGGGFAASGPGCPHAGSVGQTSDA